ncbi:MAG: DUF1186 domain-containing protein, partial [Elusimicrobia bacterium]|nr:DUF1186 domain-containing protein [Elusimicrobiota bacterium]
MFGLRLGSPKKSLQTLLNCGLDVPEGLPQEILSFGKKALKPLAAIMLDKKLHNAEWPKGWAPIHAMYLLGALGEPDALPYFEKLFSLDLDDGFSDFITEDGPAILAGLGPGAISGIKRLARLKSLDPFN